VNNSTAEIIRLLGIPGVGPRKALDLLNHFKSIASIYAASPRELEQVPGIHHNLAEQILRPMDLELLAGQLRLLEKYDTQLISIWDEAYPSQLKEIYDPPIALFCRGDLSLLHARSMAMVGTRMPTSYGKEVARTLSQQLVQNGLTVVSGGARGIDTISHQAALDADGATIAVLGNGVDRVYPAENKRLAADIVEKGLLISEFLMGSKPDAPNFPRRNRIISGLSLGTLVVEAADQSGSLITAFYALDQNREVFAIPGSIRSKESTGTNRLIKHGAKLVTGIEDILAEFGERYKLGVSEGQQEMVIAQDPQELAITKHLNRDTAIHIDDLAMTCGQTTFALLSLLLQLEMKGLVQQMPGKYFKLK
jgi:DNA processing protein